MGRGQETPLRPILRGGVESPRKSALTLGLGTDERAEPSREHPLSLISITVITIITIITVIIVMQ